MLSEGDVYRCKGHFGYCEEHGRCTMTSCPNWPNSTTLVRPDGRPAEDTKGVLKIRRSKEPSSD